MTPTWKLPWKRTDEEVIGHARKRLRLSRPFVIISGILSLLGALALLWVVFGFVEHTINDPSGTLNVEMLFGGVVGFAMGCMGLGGLLLPVAMALFHLNQTREDKLLLKLWERVKELEGRPSAPG